MDCKSGSVASVTVLECKVTVCTTTAIQIYYVFCLPLTVQLILSFCLQEKMRESEASIADHESFHDSLLNIEKWLMIMKQKLESFHSPSEAWSIEGRQHEAEVGVCVSV